MILRLSLANHAPPEKYPVNIFGVLCDADKLILTSVNGIQYCHKLCIAVTYLIICNVADSRGSDRNRIAFKIISQAAARISI